MTLVLPGCGYSLSGRGSFLPAYIKVIGVPMFTNSTPVFDVEKRITEHVISEFIGRGKYKVEPDGDRRRRLAHGRYVLDHADAGGVHG